MSSLVLDVLEYILMFFGRFKLEHMHGLSFFLQSQRKFPKSKLIWHIYPLKKNNSLSLVEQSSAEPKLGNT